MAEEDIIFGKNRHLYGGIEPSNMVRFSAKRIAHSMNIEIAVELPSDTVINGQTLCTVAGAVIRKSTERYPVDEFDGELVADVTTNGIVATSGGGEIYYSAFPYSDQGVYNRSDANRTYVKDPNKGIYGYDLDTTDPDPATRVTYSEDCDNYYYASAAMDKTSGVFNYGDWPSEAGDIFMPRPCMLKYDGTVDYYLDPNDYSKKEDGTSSDISNTAYGGNAMMEWPKIYTKRWEDEDGIYHFRCSLIKPDDTYECWCNYDKNDNEIDHFYTSIYECVADSKYVARSLSGYAKLHSNINYSSIDRSTKLIIRAHDNGDDWTNEVLSDHLLITDLLVMICKTTDLQTAIGNGSYFDASTKTGTMDKCGLFYHNPASRCIKVFGMENWWGNGSRYMAGLAGFGKTIYVKFTRGTKDGSKLNDYYPDRSSTFWESNCTYSYTQLATLSADGYISECKCTDAGRVPIITSGSVAGSSTTYECDYIDVSNTSDGKLCEIGVNVDGKGGPFEYKVTINEDNDVSYEDIGVGLSCKPSAT